MKNSAVTTYVEIENGVYDARWSAYHLEILNPDNSILIAVKTHIGVKGINIKKQVRVKDGLVEFIK